MRSHSATRRPSRPLLRSLNLDPPFRGGVWVGASTKKASWAGSLLMSNVNGT
jgi:hypothetical protein